jgi:wyosine [tRNA(Phe)-imidazoG37] synthetase (radical SAM superfamily)
VTRRLDFRDHRRELDANRYVYAVVSRRARGLSIGINLNPDKACNFACPYCQVDRTTPGGPPRVEVGVLQAELVTLLDGVRRGTIWTRSPFDTVAPGMRRLADLAFSGDGEPTASPAFVAAAAAVRAARDGQGLAPPIRLLTNATRLDRAPVRQALGAIDELWCKLDAGTAEYFALVDGTRLSFDRILRNVLDVSRERPITIQSLFLALAGEGPPEVEVTAYLGRLSELLRQGGRIERVQVYTVARRPADPRVAALPPARLESIARRVRALGVPTEVYS